MVHVCARELRVHWCWKGTDGNYQKRAWPCTKDDTWGHVQACAAGLPCVLVLGSVL